MMIYFPTRNQDVNTPNLISASSIATEISFTDILNDEFLCDELINLGLRLVEKIKEKGSLY